MSQQDVLDLVERFSTVEREGDVEAYDALLTPDFTGIGPVGFALGRQEWIGRHGGGLTNHEFTVDQPEVRFYGDDTAVVTAVQRQRTTARGHEVNGAFRLTLLAVRGGDRWTIANAQLSGPLQAPTAPPAFATGQGV